jgi:hypothetical protein
MASKIKVDTLETANGSGSITLNNPISGFTSTGIDDNATSTAITIDSSENVGVGTASPLSGKKLTVAGGAFAVTGQNTAHSANALVLGEEGSGVAQLRAYGPDTSTAGSFRFTQSSSDSSVSVETLLIDAAGNVTMPLQPAFFAYPNSNQSNISTGTSTIVLNAERFDQGGDFNTGTSTFTAPVTGKYQFNLNIRIGSTLDTAANFYRSQIITSNSDYYPTIMSPQFTADTNYWHITFSVLADMDAGDTAYTRVEQNGGSVQTDIDGGSTSTNFSGFLVA